MTIVAIVFRILAGLISAYMILCVVRIFMSWFPVGLSGKPATFIEGATEPYLAIFRRIPFLQGGGMDFSPIAALAVLAAVSRALTVASHGALTVGLLLVVLVEMIWSPVSFLLSFIAVLVLARIVAFWARWNSLHPAWRAVDAIINPALFQIKRLVYRDRIVNYMQGLITGFLALAGVRILLGFAIAQLIRLLGRI